VPAAHAAAASKSERAAAPLACSMFPLRPATKICTFAEFALPARIGRREGEGGKGLYSLPFRLPHRPSAGFNIESKFDADVKSPSCLPQVWSCLVVLCWGVLANFSRPVPQRPRTPCYKLTRWEPPRTCSTTTSIGSLRPIQQKTGLFVAR